MRYLPLDEITEDMCLARPIFNGDGRILLSNGVRLTKNYLARLKEMGYQNLYVYRAGEEINDFSIPVSDQTMREAIHGVKDAFSKAAQRQHLNTRSVNEIVNYILDEILTNPTVLYNLMDIKNHDNYYYHHCVNVGIISTLIAKEMGFSRDKMKDLTTGALLHDLGMVCVDPKILTQPRPLTDEEMAAVREHTNYGFQLLRSERDLSILVAHTAWQHHERMDGSGYPKGLVGEEIHLFGRIVAVADSYETMTSGRVYQKAMWSHEAIRQLKESAPEKYDPQVVAAMERSIASYPVGSVVVLNTHEEAVVVDVNAKKITIQFSSGPRVNALMDLEPDSEIKIEERLS
ncbi:MAG TPA: HD-GYP domain-containing protein [Firmicutes bacterium]|uniref:HD-GYP domain-containing protein n=1 Tax=Capillibacterium thermochitinicola TaxID=2699427 RepID=A0A8J6HX86_9FIRM|nr:HD-GYP domain-containing protein [Capillibacterium thermochitinicola]MBA2133062.1 HD-GYP domain-containing protein [Capillibacterium thermochitinicola]HHW13045.1 HD-GYP domain-containing protein [Bacillota bacterium]